MKRRAVCAAGAAVAMLAAALALPVTVAAAAPECTALASLRLRAAHVTSAVELRDAFPAGIAGGPASPLAAPVCRVAGVARPSRASRVAFEVWMPLGEAWNGKYLQLGNGGFSGQMPHHDVPPLLARGYAVALTDGGHTGQGYTDATWALGAPDAVQDYGHRAVKATRDAAGGVLRSFRGVGPRHAYFVGCSNGGRDALVAAQRYPRDFDGIVAGAPAVSMTRLMEYHGRIARRLAQPRGALRTAKLVALHGAAVAACDAGRGYLSQPEACRFDPGALACAAGVDADDCLTPDELVTVRSIHAGLGPSRQGAAFAGPPAGSAVGPAAWEGWLLGSSAGDGVGAAGREFATGFYASFVRGEPGFRIADLSERDIEAGHRRYAAILNATNPDLRPFARRGGRLLHYHGWNDAGIPASMSIEYHRAVRARVGDADAFHRLFLLPGVLHCGGGPGADSVDWLSVLEAWVERGIAPEHVEARRRGDAPTAPATLLSRYVR